MARRAIKKTLVYSTALIVFLILVSPFVLDKIVNYPFVKHKISSLIEQKTGVKIDQDRIDFKFLPKPGIRFKKIKLSFGKILQVDIGSVNININFLKLLTGKLVASKIFVESPYIRYTPPQNVKNSTESSQGFHFKLPEEQIQRLFTLFPNGQDKIELIVDNIQSEYFESMNGSVFVSNTDKTLIFNSTIRGLNVQKKQFAKNSFLEKIDIDAVNCNEINMVLKLNKAGVLSGNLQAKAPQVLTKQIHDKPLAGDLLDFNFQFSNQYVSILIKPITLSYPLGKVGVNFTDDKKAKKTVLTFTGDDIDISQARRVCLSLIGSNRVVKELFDILRGGTAKKVTVGFSDNNLGTLFAGKNLFLTGSAENNLVKIPKTPLIAKKVYGDAVLKNGILHIKVKKGQVSTTIVKDGWLDINLLHHKDIPFDGEFNLHSDLSTLPRVLISLLPDTLLSKELARVKEVSGQADAFLKLGKKTMQKLSVQVKAQNLSLKGSYDLIGLPITITKGVFLYENDKVILKDFTGSLENSLVQNLNLEIDFSQSPHFNISAGQGKISLDEIIPWLKSYDQITDMLSPVKNINGTILIDGIKLAGPIFTPDKWKFDIKGSGENVNLIFAQNKKEIEELFASFHLTDQMTKIQGLKGQIQDLSWLTPAIKKENLASIRLPLKISEASFETAKNTALFQGKLVFVSGPQLFFNLAGKSIKELFPKLLILKDKELSDATVILNKDTSKPLLNFKGLLNTQTLEKLLVKGSFLDKLIVSFTAGIPIKVFTDTDSNLHINTDKINLNSFLAIDDRKKKPKGQVLFDQKTLYLKTQQLTYKKMHFSNIDTQIDFNKDKTKIKLLNADLCDLSATGMAQLTHSPQGNQVTTDFYIQSLGKDPMAKMLSCLLEKTHVIDGPYSFSCTVTGQAPSDMILKSQNGSLTLNATNGRIYKWTFLSRLLSVFNILHFTDITKEGIGYKTIVIEADIKDSIIYLKKAVIDADNMALIFSGWIDPLNNKLDITCLLAPFKTIDTIIKYIPVLNTMLRGRLASFPAKVTGSITDPLIIPLHPSAVGKGLINMLEDILKTPVRLFEDTP
ncbi:MAG: hypothetical protein GY710_26065 [Desulfobacteraceae bacterium]|nr:hypothetical protein [Desulfobacteraceae bacterium]